MCVSIILELSLWLYVQLCIFVLSIVVTVSFNQSVYSVDENDGPAQPVLVLSNPSSTDITVQVFNINGSATGKWDI